MRNRFLPFLAAAFAVPVFAAVIGTRGQDFTNQFAAFAEPAELMRGCTDIPEAVALAETLKERSLRIEQYMASIEQKKLEIADAEDALRKRAEDLKRHKEALRSRSDTKSTAIRDDIDRLIAVYDQMKPTDAGEILTNLPSDFAAEILLRIDPENGARIIAAIEPKQAAVLTAEMGARSIRNP